MTTMETSAVTFGNTTLPYSIRRSTRRKKTVAVTVDPTEGVLLVAPEHLTMKRLDAVVRQKARWIVQRLRHVQSNGTSLPPREFVSGESVLYLGRHYRLKVHPRGYETPKLRGGWLHVSAPGGPNRTTQVREAVVSWLRQHAAQRLPERIETWYRKAGVPMPRIVIADQQKRWGSCDNRGTIRLNWRIIQAPMRLVDYVIVHELVHLRHRGHGSNYWQALGRVMPDYERRREELGKRGSDLTR